MIRWLLLALLFCSLVSCGDEADYQAWLVSQANATDKQCGRDTDLNGSVDSWCPSDSKDEDGDGFTSDGSGDFGAGSATVSGAQTSVNTITVNAAQTMITGMTAVFYDSVSTSTVTRDVLAWTDTTITISGAAVSVANGAAISAGTVIDPDDHNFYMRPGVFTTAGCSAGQYRQGLNSGSYSACAALTGFTCHTGVAGSATWFADDAVSTCTGTNSYANPWSYKCFSDPGMSGYHAPVYGDCIALFRGAYSGTWTGDSGVTVHQLWLNNRDGTAKDPIRVMPVPGDAWWQAGVGSGVVIQGEGTHTSNCGTVNGNQSGSAVITMNSSGFSIPAGFAVAYYDRGQARTVTHGVIAKTSTTFTIDDGTATLNNGDVISCYQEVIPVDVNGSDFVDVSGLEIDQKAGGFSNSGLQFADTSIGVRASNLYVHSIDGEEDNNLTCIKLRGSTSFSDVGWSVLKDCYERSATTGDEAWNSSNNSEFRSMDSDGVRVHHLTITTGGAAAYGISFKHSVASAKGCHVYRNIIFNTHYDGIAMDAIAHSRVHDNFIDVVNVLNSGACFHFANLGGATAIYDDLDVSYNYCFGAGSFQFIPEQTSDLGHTIFNFHHNVIVDNRATTYPGDASDGFQRMCFYCDDTQYSYSVPRMVSDYNCYWNSEASPPALLFSWFGYDGGSAGDESGYHLNGLSAWQSATGQETHSFYEDPAANSNGQPTSTNCIGAGPRFGVSATPTPQPAFMPYLQ